MNPQHTIQSQSLRPRSLLLTVYGAFIRALGGWVAVRDLVVLFGDLGVEPGTLRAALSRLKAGGTVVPEKRGTVSGYRLSANAESLVAEGEQRMRGQFGRTCTEDGWIVAVFSVPEDQRASRSLLTNRLAWLGYGNMSAGVRIAPASQLADTKITLERLGLTGYVHLLRAHYDAFQDLTRLVRTWWDLDGMASGYATFLDAALPVLKKWAASPEIDPRGAFVDYVRVRTLWRRLPYLDPGLPDELYPSGWPRQNASEVFTTLDDLLRAAALRHVQGVTKL